MTHRQPFRPLIVALVPMRHQSERVPGKNYRSFAGRPLFHHIVRALLGSSLIHRVVIDTDSELIVDDAARSFPKIQVVERPPHLRTPTTPMNEVLLHDVAQIEADYYLQTHSTNPLLRTETIDAAVKAFIDALPQFDSLFSVTPLHARLWSVKGEPMNHDPDVLLRTQDLEPLLEENSCLYMFSRQTLERNRNRIGKRPLIYQVRDRSEAWDIDDELDFVIAEFLYRKREGISA